MAHYTQDTATTVYLKSVAAEKQEAVAQYLMSSADEMGLFLVRQDMALEGEGIFNGLKLGVYGDYHRDDINFSFLNTQILNSEKLEKLLTATSPESTLGVEAGSIHSVGEIPSFRFFERVVVKQLPALISDSKTVGGAYAVTGLEEQEQAIFLQTLSEISGISQATLIEPSSGTAVDRNFMRDALFLFLGILAFLNSIFFLVITVKSLPREGKLIMLGWSQAAFAKETLGKFLVMGAAGIPLFLIIGFVFAGWGQFSLPLLGYYLLSTILNLLVLLLELLLSAIIILRIKSLDAIRGRLPKRALYAFGIPAKTDEADGTTQDTPLNDLRPMVMLGGKMYYDTGKISTIDGRCGVMDGEITSTVDGTQAPTEDNQSNFGSGYEYQFVAKNTVEIIINEKWCVFEYISKQKYSDEGIRKDVF